MICSGAFNKIMYGTYIIERTCQMNESLQRILFLDGKYISKQLVYHIQDCIIYLVFFKYMYMYNLQKIPPTFNKIEIMHKHVYTFVYQDILISLKKVN